MHCNKCGQPLQPWEITTCEPCLRRIQNFPNLQLTQQRSAATLPQTPSKVQGGTKSKEAEMEPAAAAAVSIVILGVLGYFAQGN